MRALQEGTLSYVTCDGDMAEFRVGVRNGGAKVLTNVRLWVSVPQTVQGLEEEGFTVTDGRGKMALAPALEPGRECVTYFHLRVVGPLVNDVLTLYHPAIVCDQEAPLVVADVTASIPSHVNFDNDGTSLGVVDGLGADGALHLGDECVLRLAYENDGRSIAREAQLHLRIPKALSLALGSVRVNGRVVSAQPLAETAEDFGGYAVQLPVVAPGERGEVLARIFVDPAELLSVRGRQSFDVLAELRCGALRQNRTAPVTVEALPEILASAYLSSGSDCIRPGDTVPVAVDLKNAGAGVAHDLVVHVEVPNGEVAGANVDVTTEYDVHRNARIYVAKLAELLPGDRSVMKYNVTAPPFANRGDLVVHAAYSVDGGELIGLDELVLKLAAVPAFSESSSGLELLSEREIRPGETFTFIVTLKNEGAVRADDVRLHLALPDTVSVMQCDGADLDGTTLRFGNLAAGLVAQALVQAQLRVAEPGHHVMPIDARVLASEGVPADLRAVALRTYGEPVLRMMLLRSQQTNAGTDVVFTLENRGDSFANDVTLELSDSDFYEVAPYSTSIDGQLLADNAGVSPLQRGGVRLSQFTPGAAASLGMRLVPLEFGAPSRIVPLGVRITDSLGHSDIAQTEVELGTRVQEPTQGETGAYRLLTPIAGVPIVLTSQPEAVAQDPWAAFKADEAEQRAQDESAARVAAAPALEVVEEHVPAAEPAAATDAPAGVREEQQAGGDVPLETERDVQGAVLEEDTRLAQPPDEQSGSEALPVFSMPSFDLEEPIEEPAKDIAKAQEHEHEAGAPAPGENPWDEFKDETHPFRVESSAPAEDAEQTATVGESTKARDDGSYEVARPQVNAEELPRFQMDDESVTSVENAQSAASEQTIAFGLNISQAWLRGVCEQLKSIRRIRDRELYVPVLASRWFFPDSVLAHPDYEHRLGVVTALEVVRASFKEPTLKAVLYAAIDGFKATDKWVKDLESETLVKSLSSFTSVVAQTKFAESSEGQEGMLIASIDESALEQCRQGFALPHPIAPSYAFAIAMATYLPESHEVSNALAHFQSELQQTLLTTNPNLAYPLRAPIGESLDDALTKLVDVMLQYRDDVERSRTGFAGVQGGAR